MKRKILTALVIAGGLFLTACQEDATMDELIQDTELDGSLGKDVTGNGNGSGGDGDGGDGDGGVGGN